jgi:hypothetical protein
MSIILKISNDKLMTSTLVSLKTDSRSRDLPVTFLSKLLSPLPMRSGGIGVHLFLPPKRLIHAKSLSAARKLHFANV